MEDITVGHGHLGKDGNFIRGRRRRYALQVQKAGVPGVLM